MNRHLTLFETLGDRILDALVAGVSVRDAAAAAGCTARTVERWLIKGRTDPAGRYGAFASAVDESRRRRAISPLPTGEMGEYELAVAVSELARVGSVPAMRLYWQMLQRASTPLLGRGSQRDPRET